MASIKDMLGDNQVDSLHVVVEDAGKKFLCFTRLSSDAWILCVTDGYDLWRLELDADDLTSHRDLAEVSTLDAYLLKFRNAFQSGEVQVIQSGVKASLQVGQGINVLNFELYETKAVDTRTELSSVLFRLAEAATDLASQLEKATGSLDTLKQLNSGTVAGGVFDQDSGKKKNAAANQAKSTARMSIVNPGSKKRKAAQGVQFD